jgi:hypothetical protein
MQRRLSLLRTNRQICLERLKATWLRHTRAIFLPNIKTPGNCPGVFTVEANAAILIAGVNCFVNGVLVAVIWRVRAWSAAGSAA